jgi:hypothetical protein
VPGGGFARAATEERCAVSERFNGSALSPTTKRKVMSKRVQFNAVFSGQRGEFVSRALDNVHGLKRSGLATALVIKWAEGVLGEKAPAPSPRGAHWANGADPNGLTATARRLGISITELRKRLLKEGLQRMSLNGSIGK